MIKNVVSTAIIILGLLFTLNANASDYGPVAAKETLWDIASRNRPSYDITTQQMMLAIRRANPNAFQTKNINSLKAGAVLRLPSLTEINKANKSKALHVAKRQNARWQAKKSEPESSKKNSIRPPSSYNKKRYKRYYKASQRELRKLQKRLDREQRNVRRLKRKLAKTDSDIPSSTKNTSGTFGNITILQDEVKSLEKTIQEKNVHIAQLENMKKVAAETIKKQSQTNEILFNKLKAIDPSQVINEAAASGSLQLQGIDNTLATSLPPNTTKSGQSDSLLATTNNEQKNIQHNSGFIIVIAVLALLFALALLWRLYSQSRAKKYALKRDNNERSDQDTDEKDGESTTTHRKEPLLST